MFFWQPRMRLIGLSLLLTIQSIVTRLDPATRTITASLKQPK